VRFFSERDSFARRNADFTIKNSYAAEYMMNPVDKLPLGALYIYTPRNCLGEEEKALKNIPYIDDNTASDDNPFLATVISCYNRIHEEAVIKDDNIFLNIVLHLCDDKPDWNDFEIEEEENINFSDIPKEDLEEAFKAISISFVDEGTEDDIRQRFQRLTQPKSQTSFTPNIDSVDALSVSRERSLDSFKTQFCRRCLMYDCFLHLRDHDLPPEMASKIKIRQRHNFVENTTLSSDPCSGHCFKKEKKRGFLSLRQEKVVLKPSQESLIRVLWESCPADFCFIREAINNKYITCSMIHNWCQKNIENFKVMMSRHDNYSTELVDRTKGNVHPPLKPMPKLRHYTEVCAGVSDSEEEDQGEKTNGSSHSTDKKKKGKKTSISVAKKKQRTWQKRAIANASGSLNRTEEGIIISNYTPCVLHPGEDCHVTKDCLCKTAGHLCEKYCLCSSSCQLRFPGCTCTGQCNTKQCPCFCSARECDPDLCIPCGAGDMPEPKKCNNVPLQRMHKKHLFVAPSSLGKEAGWGCFIKKNCLKNDLISEYVGEIITQVEADKRGLIYDRKKHSFLFSLNNEFSVDATRIGNKIRFANHSVNPNCFAKIVKVNGEHRIGIYAKHDIRAGEELFFDYKYGPNERIEFVPIEQKDCTMTKNPKVLFRKRGRRLLKSNKNATTSNGTSSSQTTSSSQGTSSSQESKRLQFYRNHRYCCAHFK
jgi:hypothetical protein